MSKKRALAASLITPEKNLWVTGGLDYDTNTPFSSTEHILKNGESVKGPELPLALVGHAVIAINSTFSMFTGGETPVGGSINYTGCPTQRLTSSDQILKIEKSHMSKSKPCFEILE